MKIIVGIRQPSRATSNDKFSLTIHPYIFLGKHNELLMLFFIIFKSLTFFNYMELIVDVYTHIMQVGILKRELY